MKDEYQKTHAITYTEVNQKGEFNVIAAFHLVQNIMTEYFESFESDNLRLKQKDHAIWVVSKTKLHFYQFPLWRDVICGDSYTTEVKPIRIEIESNFQNEKAEEIFVAKQECCVIDLETRRLRKIDTVHYPTNIKKKETKWAEPYLRLKEEFSEEDYVYSQKIFSSDIDFSRHTNNVAYVKWMMNTLPCQFFDDNQILDFEIHYLQESREGEEVRIYKKEKGTTMEFLIKAGEKEIARAGMTYCQLVKDTK